MEVNQLFSSEGIELNLAIKLQKKGGIRGGSVVPVPMMENSWELWLEDNNGARFPLVKYRAKTPKVYKTWSSAVSDAKRVGLKDIVLVLQ